MDEGQVVSPTRSAQWAILCVVLLYVAWVGAWVLSQMLQQYVTVLTTSQGLFVYWLGMRLVLWVPIAFLLLRVTGRRFGDVMGFQRLRAALLWGVGVGLVLGVIAVGGRLWMHESVLSFDGVLSVVSAVVIAPVVEEVVFRGAVLYALLPRFRFWGANVIAALLFVGVHVPGWYFQGVLVEMVRSPWHGAVSIFILGVVFGFVAYRSRSVCGSIVCHALNNFFNV